MWWKVPDTWWGAVVVGVLMGAAGGVTAALMDGIWSSDSVAHRLFVAVPGWMAGCVVLCMLKHAHDLSHARRQVYDARRRPSGSDSVSGGGGIRTLD